MSPASSAFSSDSQTAMLEAASEINHQIPQACFTSRPSRRFWEHLVDIEYPSLISMPRATTLPLS